MLVACECLFLLIDLISVKFPDRTTECKFVIDLIVFDSLKAQPQNEDASSQASLFEFVRMLESRIVKMVNTHPPVYKEACFLMKSMSLVEPFLDYSISRSSFLIL